MDTLAFDNPLNRWMDERGITQSEMARRLGVSRYSVIKWLNCLCLPDRFNMLLIAQVTGDSEMPRKLTEYREMVCGLEVSSVP